MKVSLLSNFGPWRSKGRDFSCLLAMASSSEDMLNLDVRMCKICKQIGYLRKTGCVRTDCDAYYLKVGQTAKTPGPWSRGSSGSNSWSPLTRRRS